MRGLLMVETGVRGLFTAGVVAIGVKDFARQKDINNRDSMSKCTTRDLSEKRSAKRRQRDWPRHELSWRKEERSPYLQLRQTERLTCRIRQPTRPERTLLRDDIFALALRSRPRWRRQRLYKGDEVVDW